MLINCIRNVVSILMNKNHEWSSSSGYSIKFPQQYMFSNLVEAFDFTMNGQQDCVILSSKMLLGIEVYIYMLLSSEINRNLQPD